MAFLTIRLKLVASEATSQIQGCQIPMETSYEQGQRTVTSRQNIMASNTEIGFVTDRTILSLHRG